MREVLSQHVNLTDSEYEALCSKARLKRFKKKQTLLHAGQTTSKLFFVKNGLIRGYRIVDGVDVTHHFFVNNWWATDYESFLTGKKGDLFLEALSEVEAYQFSKSDVDALYAKYHSIEKIGRKMAEYAYQAMVERLRNFQTVDLKGRYEALVDKNPKLFEDVPQKYIASYLGVTPPSLSRIKETSK